ncbi:iduronate 2-sulfatase-like [Amphiura filiformis]|uniref:iduronate 2-sulfatase-like n=1 Tax=Amphiura filiformis TaxID=82378 RepID=UPI003B222F03
MAMLRLNLQFVWLVTIIACSCTATCDATASRPNILLVVSDDLRPSLGSYGEPVLTPNLDQLAAQSIRFTNAHVQQAVCGPSRISFLTSRRPDTTRLYDFYSYWREAAGNFTTLPQHFKENGYYAASVGKVFHNGKASNFTDDYPLSWSVPPYWPPSQKYKRKKVCGPGPDGELHEYLICPVNVTQHPLGTLPDIQSTDYALEILKNLSKYQSNSSPDLKSNDHSSTGDNDRMQPPFFLAVGYHKPHIPLKYPQEFRDLYPLDSIDIAPDIHLPQKVPPVAWNPWTDVREREDIAALNVSFPYGPMPLEYHYLIRQSYYAAVTYIDYQVGRLLAGLEESGFAKNTIVLFVGDHGWQLGEHQEWAKYSNYGVATRVPLIIHIPGVTDTVTSLTKRKFPFINPLLQKVHFKPPKSTPRGNKVNRSPASNIGYSTNSPVELVDMFPTLADLAGLKIPPTCPENSLKNDFCTEGSSLTPLIDNVTGKSKSVMLRWKNGTFSQYSRPSDVPQQDSDMPHLANITIMGYSMRTDNYHYTEWIGFDPHKFQGNWQDVHARELYVLDDDPHEDFNVADDPRYESVIKDLSKKLQGGWRYSLPVFDDLQ